VLPSYAATLCPGLTAKNATVLAGKSIDPTTDVVAAPNVRWHAAALTIRTNLVLALNAFDLALAANVRA
tara:strand:+ start:49 stop:255 length:207 start_codon:yes stop_codon:yes gene_type:complete